MSSLTIVGFFAVANGKRVLSTRPNSNTRTAHCFYTTAVQCSSSVALPAEIRVYSPQNDVSHADGLVVFLMAKASFPAHDTVLLDAYLMVLILGDPFKEEYDDSLPDMPFPLLFGLGSVLFKIDERADSTRTFQVAVAKYVRDSTKTSNVECLYTSPRWSNTPAPNLNSCVEFIGQLARVTPTGLPGVDLLNIVLNAGAPITAGPGPPAPNTPKHKQFSAFAGSPVGSPRPSSVVTMSILAPVTGVPTITPSTLPDPSAPVAEASDAIPLTIMLWGAASPSSDQNVDKDGGDNDDSSVPQQLLPSAKALGKCKSMK